MHNFCIKTQYFVKIIEIINVIDPEVRKRKLSNEIALHEICNI